MDPITASRDTKPGTSAPVPELQVRHVPERERYEAEVEGRLAAVAQYRSEGSRVAFLHTQTMAGFERRGIATRLVEHVLREFEADGREVLPFCWFVRDVIARDDQLIGLVPAAERSRFGL